MAMAWCVAFEKYFQIDDRLEKSFGCLGEKYLLTLSTCCLLQIFCLEKESLWGFPLGQRLRDIRVKGYYLKGKNSGARRRQLDALGFNWEPKRGRPPRKN